MWSLCIHNLVCLSSDVHCTYDQPRALTPVAQKSMTNISSISIKRITTKKHKICISVKTIINHKISIYCYIPPRKPLNNHKISIYCYTPGKHHQYELYLSQFISLHQKTPALANIRTRLPVSEDKGHSRTLFPSTV